jgi:hypothetical protein
MMMRGELNQCPPLLRRCDVARKDRPHLRGRRPVRADRRLHADKKRIRAQSTILDKSLPHATFVFIHNRVFGTDTPFIRTKNTVGARSAQWSLLARSRINAPHLELR